MDKSLKTAIDRLVELPPQARTEVSRGVQLRKKKTGQTVLTLHYSAIPERDPATREGIAWRAAQKKIWSSEARWKKEQEIDPDATGGEAVFGSVLSDHYEKIVISDKHWYPDPQWDVVFGFDHGKVNATCMEKAYVTRSEINPQTGKPLPPDVYLCGEYYSMKRPGWDNNVDQNVQAMMRGVRMPDGTTMGPMPDLERARWRVADPSIFNEGQAQAKGDYTSIYREYQKAGFAPLTAFDGVRLDTVFVETMLSDYWSGLQLGRRPRCYIVCRNPADRPQPGLHPYDSPNLLWELKRTRRVEISARQLLTRNLSEAIIDRDNHARDAVKYLLMKVKKGAPTPLHEAWDEQLQNLDPTTRTIRARHLFSEAVMRGEIDWQGKAKKSAPVISLRGRRR